MTASRFASVGRAWCERFGPLTPRRAQALWLLLALLPALSCAVPIIDQIPMSRDHATHLFKVWHFWEVLIPNLQLRGWMPFWGFGAPADELVPCGGEVWVGLFKAASLWQLSWERAYAVAFAALMVFKCWAAYRFTRLYFSTGAAVLCSWFTFADPGGMLEGGWEWHTYWGVWPVTLSMSLVLLCLERLEHVLRSGRARDVLFGGLWFGAALLTHQMGLVAVAIALPVLCADHLVRKHPAPLGRVLQVLGAVLLGVALVGYYFIPFLARTAHTQDLGWMHEPLSVIGQRLITLQTFQGVWPPIQLAGIVGAVLAARSRKPGALFNVGSAAALVLLASDLLVGVFHLERAFPIFYKVEYSRLLLVAKLFWFPLAGHALVTLWSVGKAKLRPYLRGALVLGATATVLVSGADTFYEQQIKKPIVGLRELDAWEDFERAIAWTNAEKSKNPGFFRVAYAFAWGNHISTAFPVWNQLPMYKVGYTPTQIFDKLPAYADAQLYRAMSIKYVVSTRELKHPTLKLLQRYGVVRIYAFTQYDPNPFTVIGKGNAELLEFSAERLRIKLTGTDAGTRLKLHVASYDRWRVHQAGRSLPITTVPVYGPHYPVLMEVPAGDGELVLSYDTLLPDWVGLACSLLCLPGFFFVTWTSRRSALLPRLLTTLERRRRTAFLAAGGAALVLLLVTFQRTQTRKRLLPPSSVFHQLQDGQLSLADVPCVQEQELVFRCDEHTVSAETLPGSYWGVHRCVHAPSVGPLRITAPLPMKNFVAIKYMVPKQGKGTIDVRVNGRSLGKVNTLPAFLRQQALAFDTRSFRGREAQLELELSGAAVHCFNLQLVD